MADSVWQRWSGSPAAQLFARMDDGAGGRLQTFKRRFKFQCRYWWHRHHLRGVAAHIDSLGLAPHLANDPEVPLRSMRPYLWSGLSGAGRAQALQDHLGWLAGTWAPADLLLLYEQGCVLRQWQAGDHSMCVVLRPGRDLGREGELELHLLLDGAAVVRASFSVLHGKTFTQPGLVMVIGNLQGVPHGQDLVRQLSGATEKTRPSHLLLNALQGLAQGWGLAAMLGVSNRGHVYARYAGLRKRVGISYDALWQELGAAQRVSALHWALPVQWVGKPLEEVASKKRSELRRRNALRLQTLDDCRRAAQQLSGRSVEHHAELAPVA